MSLDEQAMELHRKLRGKIEVVSTTSVKDTQSLSLAYTPGVAAPCLAIEKDESLAYDLTRKWNLALVISDGTAVLGLGDIGPSASMPVMEGKCVLFKEFGDVDAFPMCIDSKDVDTIVNTVALISKSFGGINLEDISAPRCFEIERKLKERCDIPIFHDDQHGTAVVVLSGLINAMKLTGKEFSAVKAVVNGSGAAGIAITKLLLKMGLADITLCDSKGIVCEGDPKLNSAKQEIALVTNRRHLQGKLADALVGTDIFIGVSAPNIVTSEMVKSMAKDPIFFALSNPVPEINPDLALQAGAKVVGTGRSDYPNQVNNVLAFPGIFRGTLDVRASDINDEMKIAAAYAIASLISDEDRANGIIIPQAFDPRVGPAVSKAVAQAAVKSGVARLPLPEQYR